MELARSTSGGRTMDGTVDVRVAGPPAGTGPVQEAALATSQAGVIGPLGGDAAR